MWPDPGQEAARAALSAAHRRGRLPPTLLLTGAEGLELRALALWLVALRWCAAPNEAPCGVCGSCQRVAGGQHPDLELVAHGEGEGEGEGGGAGLGVDVVRARIVAPLGLRSVEGGGRAVIVDGADALNEAAQNALLKTLEEPPRGALLLLLTAHPSALLATVASRCPELRLAPVDDALLAARHPQADPERLSLARGREGRLKALEQLDVAALRETFDALLGGQLGAAGALGVLPVESAPDVQRLALDVLLARLLDHARERGLDPVPGQRALDAVRADLARHIPARVAWLAGSMDLRAAYVGAREAAAPQS